ncbi:MAG: DUF402 domain-containing protein [Clostridia bacterium]
MDYTFIRKRFIPEEEVDISGDEVLYDDGDLLVTRWLPIRTRNDIGWGFSYIYIPGHYKISAFFDCEGRFKYWYCDVIKTEYEKEQNKYIFIDLLIDVIIEPGERCRVLDEDELQEAFLRGLISDEDVKIAHDTRDEILRMCEHPEAAPKFPGAPRIGEILPPEGFTKLA